MEWFGVGGLACVWSLEWVWLGLDLRGFGGFDHVYKGLGWVWVGLWVWAGLRLCVGGFVLVCGGFGVGLGGFGLDLGLTMFSKA